MPVVPLPPEKLRRLCATDALAFETTADLEPLNTIIGQPRGTRAIAFGITIPSEGYNIFVMGPMGSGRETAIMRYLQTETQGQKRPCDWVYVHNFKVPHKPRAIDLPAGRGAEMKADMARLISELRQELPEAFDSDAYEATIRSAREAYEQQRSQRLQAFQQQAAEMGFGLVQTASGMGVTPVMNGRQLTQEELQQLPIAEQQKLQQAGGVLSDDLADLQAELYALEMETRQQIRQIDREVAAAAIDYRFDELKKRYADHDEALLYFGEVREDVLNQIDDFAPQLESEGEIDLRRYQVNLFVDNRETEGAPVIIEDNPTYYNLFGRLEYEMQGGVVTTHFTNIRCGSLHWANGGYLIISAVDLLRQPEAWQALKRAIKNGKLRVQPHATMDNSQVLAKSLSPEPIPLNLKVVITGSADIYYALFEQDEDFAELFKVRADFDSIMPWDAEQEAAYARFIATRCAEEGLMAFDNTAVAKVIEFGAREAEHSRRLSTRFGAIADLVREASHWAGQNGHAHVTAVDVQKALSERTYRANHLEELLQKDVLEGSVFIATDGEVVGQVNGLTVLDTGDYSFGQPSRITARTFMGDNGVIHIERETDMSGPIHEKGVLTLNGYLGGKYAQEQPLSLSASLTFEQQYGGIDGDSASSAEIYALLSSLSDLPVKQGIAVTGSVNQRGEVQTIGGVNEKIEGFFRLCAARGLTGEQGVVIPKSNEVNLMLHEDVVTAVVDGQFRIWSITTLDEGIEILTGTPAGEPDEKGDYPADTVHYRVHERLRQLARDLKSFGDDEEDDGGDEDE